MTISVMEDKFVALVGLDWADRKYDIFLLDRKSGEISFRQIDHNPKAIKEWTFDI